MNVREKFINRVTTFAEAHGLQVKEDADWDALFEFLEMEDDLKFSYTIVSASVASAIALSISGLNAMFGTGLLVLGMGLLWMHWYDL